MRAYCYIPLLVLLFAFGFCLNAERAHADAISAAVSSFRAAVGLQRITAVPTQNPSQDIKDTVLKPLVGSLVKTAIHQMVNSTIHWINTGFDGNPAFITDPQGYFGNISNTVIGNTIAKDPHLGFLCSPFQAKIKQALVQAYTGVGASGNTNLQCTLDTVGTNFNTFTDHFSSGDWNSFFVLTQNDANNPYGAYAAAKSYTDQKVGSAVGAAQQAQARNLGFLDVKECTDRNPELWTDVHFDDRFAPGECITEVVKTPGTTIAASLNKTLGTDADRLVQAKDIDDLLGALMGHLLNDTVLSNKGLITATPYTIPDTPDSNAPPTSTGPAFLSCAPDKVTVAVGEPVIWSAQGNYPPGTEYKWAGDDVAAATSTSFLPIHVSYTSGGIKSAFMNIGTIEGGYSSVKCDVDIFISSRSGQN